MGKITAKRIYLDYASTTPLDPRVLSVMLPYLKEDFYNPSSLYAEGVRVKKAIEASRKKIASLLFAHQDEIIFTGSGTESNNISILGVFEFYKDKIKKPHFITSKIEHASVLEVFAEIERRGGAVTYLSVYEDGIINLKELKDSLRPNTVLVSIMYANNEIGTIQPIREIAKIIRHFKKRNPEVKPRGNSTRFNLRVPYFHTDASQAANYLSLNVEQLGIDLMTLDASKIYGPKGVGMLYAKRNVSLFPIIFGGGQERGLRSGTENVAQISGAALALAICQETREKELKRLGKMQAFLVENLLKIPKITLNGSRTERLPNNVNICIEGLDAEFAVLRFDAKGIMLSSVTSCKSLKEDSSSYVIDAIGMTGCDKSSLRISMGRNTTMMEIKKFLKIFDIIAK